MLSRLSGLFRSHPPPAEQPAIPALPAGIWPVLPAAQLLQPHAKLLTRIRALAAVSDDYWHNLYQPLLDNFAAFVQQTPASEAHHHCRQGGMLTHSLQVMKLALESRKGKMLPPGAAAEDVNQQQHAWTYAIASAALLHDVGKPCSDQKLRLCEADGQATPRYWQPLHGALQSGYYRVEFVRERQYRTHELLPPLLARQLTPAAALSWLQQDFPGVFKAWLGYLSGQDEVAGIVGQIVTDADRQSVAADLSGGQPLHTQQIPAAKAKPLSQRLLTGLRFLLDEQQLPLNRKGAAGFFDGEALWLVSKRVLDELRNHLEKEGQTGIPTRNDRLMDELQQHNILTPTAAGQAIWNAEIRLGDWAQSLTLLQIPAMLLWADASHYPERLAGSITPAGQKTEETPPNLPLSGEGQEEDAIAIPLDSSPDKGRPGGVSSYPETVAPTPPSPTPDTDDAGQHFLHWLTTGLRTGKHKLNTADARLHVVREGLLLVSPAIFKDYDLGNWEYVQKRFSKLGLHRKQGNTNIWRYQVSGQKKRGVVQGMLLPDPLNVLGLGYLPSPNKALSLPETETSRNTGDS
ncbi:MobH family relaxase [Thiothrix subterranea]|uniref:MobH family relaxase n=1 Tax=Thiothrix subterranea TaxID=2735563 RepID=A0AA51MMV7_9GAMM|nr:MobH family relaxase [Thiothrix subterranea]MDQ5767902.1 MobH family relaxase [Thiothrix subterranea]WML86639.1 MobH family relaxase [Thiothrix subterranea]